MIGPNTLEKMILMTAEQILWHRELIDKAFCKADDGKLKVSIGIDLSVSEVKPGGIDVDTTISFVAERVKDKVSSTVIENQADLPLVDFQKNVDANKVYKIKGTLSQLEDAEARVGRLTAELESRKFYFEEAIQRIITLISENKRLREGLERVLICSEAIDCHIEADSALKQTESGGVK